MIFTETKLKGAFVIDIERREDSRGFFARAFCQHEFEAHGLKPVIAQANLAFNHRTGTLRGMHFQLPPAAETKLVRCTRGAIYDVVLDLRPSSPAFRDWIAVILTSANRHMVYVPEGCAHGFLTLEEETEIFYQMSEFHDAESARGVRWNDPAFRITWPGRVEVISQRDAEYAFFE